jgi:hypothetical protein
MKTSRMAAPVGRFGLFAIIKSKRVILPLKGVECDFSVVSGLVEVVMTQVFRQENQKGPRLQYLFRCLRTRPCFLRGRHQRLENPGAGARASGGAAACSGEEGGGIQDGFGGKRT